MIDNQFDPHLFEEFFNWQPQAFVWLQPIWDLSGIKIIDFEYVYSNEEGLNYLKLTRDMLGHIRISNTPSLTDGMRQGILDEMIKVFISGETASSDLYNPVINRFGRVYRIKFRGGVLTTIQDKTEERRAIQQLSERTKELQRSNESLKEFAYAASHDLQEPLRKIASFSELLQKDLESGITDGQLRLFEKLQSSVRRMKGLIEDLLEYSRLSIQREDYSMINVQEIVRGVLQDLERLIEEQKVLFEIDDLPNIRGDASQMRQLFHNLFSNAIKYRKPHEPPRISVQCTKVNHSEAVAAGFHAMPGRMHWLISIRDNGIGFDPQYEEKIFQLFQRLHGRSEYEGTGIGLSIVQKVVANHQGQVKAVGRPGEGATFLVFLPEYSMGV
jgi:signal transduction histidine kinase